MIKKTCKPILIGTRKSPLALWQANQVNKKIKEGKLIKIQTAADKFINKPLSEIGGKSLFTKELDEALLNKKIDIAVHSLKDVPTVISNKIDLAYILPRSSISDVLISKNNITKLTDLPFGSKIGTSSPRRFSQIKNIRPDINIVNIRGNIQTRINKIKEKNLDAIILALAGIKRLKIKVHYAILRSPNFLTTAGQGIIAITYLKTNNEIKNILFNMKNYPVTYQAKAERAVLEKLNGNCNSSIAVNSKIINNKISINSIVYSRNGDSFIKDSINGGLKDSCALGHQLGENLIKQGASELLTNDSN